MRAIAREIGVSHPTLVHHFGSKVGLLEAVGRQGFEELDVQLARAVDQSHPARERFISVGAAYAAFALQQSGCYRIMFRREAVEGQWEGDVENLAESCFVHLTKALEGAWPGIVAEDIATLAWSTMHGAIMLWLDGPLQQRQPNVSPLEIAHNLANVLPFPQM